MTSPAMRSGLGGSALPGSGLAIWGLILNSISWNKSVDRQGNVEGEEAAAATSPQKFQKDQALGEVGHKPTWNLARAL
jgi:hypothetical protein